MPAGRDKPPGRQAYYHRNMKRLSFKLPGALRRRVSAKARRSCADLAGKLVGSVRGGSRDASTNKRYLDEAILADYLKRPGKRRRIVLTPVRIGRADAVRGKLAALGIAEGDVQAAVKSARRRRR